MIWIRQTNPYGFRSGQWAHLFHITHNDKGDDVWVVEFPEDGEKDAWPAWDTSAGYQVKVQVEPPINV